MRYAHFAEICGKCCKKRNMRQSHIRLKPTCLSGENWQSAARVNCDEVWSSKQLPQSMNQHFSGRSSADQFGRECSFYSNLFTHPNASGWCFIQNAWLWVIIIGVLSAAGPRLLNYLPPGLRRPGLTFDSFRQSLKTHLFVTLMNVWSLYK